MKTPSTSWPASLFKHLGRLHKRGDERARTNPFVAKALENDKREGQRIAVIARTIALGLIAVVIVFLNPTVSVIYYEVVLLAFIALGWAQFRFASVGHSRTELALIFADLALLTYVCLMPNPLLGEELPSAFAYRFNGFIFFFIFLAVATLAYSWRTVLAMGICGSVLWVAGLLGILNFGLVMPQLSEASATAFAGHPTVSKFLDPNNAHPEARIWEILVLLVVTGVLTLRAWRSKQLLSQQADVAEQRANLSRYFPTSLVDELASSEHDVGAVRSQEIAVLFTDIVGFTQIAERSPPDKVMGLLRRYHAIVEAAVFDNGGTLDKYLGDGVMATFGTPNSSPDDAANALKAAKQILSGMEQFPRDCADLVGEELRVSVGVHFGPVIIGDIGPPRRLEFAVVGDTVNVASRLESASRELDCRCVVSDALIQKLQTSDTPNLPPLDGFAVKKDVALRGRQLALDVWVSE